jgi:hypothetical protein
VHGVYVWGQAGTNQNKEKEKHRKETHRQQTLHGRRIAHLHHPFGENLPRRQWEGILRR